jgi:hypothetical protein
MSVRLELGMCAPDVVLETRVHGERHPHEVAVRRGDGRWTVLVFEPEPDEQRLLEIEALRTNFVAEGALVVLVAEDAPATRLHTTIDDGTLADAFGASGAATFVLDRHGTIYDAHHGTGGEYVALAMLQALRIGGPSLRLAHAARDANLPCAA